MAEEEKGGESSPSGRKVLLHTLPKRYIIPQPGDVQTHYPPGDYELINDVTAKIIENVTGKPAWVGINWEELREEVRQVVAASPWDETKVLVSKTALIELLNALEGPGHRIREIQATRGISALMDEENPIEKLKRQVLAAGGIKRYTVPGSVEPEKDKPQ
jgi:hypothetical protein